MEGNEQKLILTLGQNVQVFFIKNLIVRSRLGRARIKSPKYRKVNDLGIGIGVSRVQEFKSIQSMTK
jgi:hypothetical protein